MLTDYGTIQPIEQILTFLYAFLFGGTLCALYDVLRGQRKVFHTGAWLLFWQDLLFCACSAVLVFCFLLVRCNGQLRIYVLFSQAVGFGVFRIMLSRYTVAAAAWIYRFLRRIINKLQRLLDAILLKTRRTWRFLFAKVKNILKRKKKPLENRPTVDV